MSKEELFMMFLMVLFTIAGFLGGYIAGRPNDQ